MPSKSANSMIAGAGGGLVASVATCPLDVVKTKLQAQRAVHGHEAYEGVVGEGFNVCHPRPPAPLAAARVPLLYACARRVELNHDGIRGMYRGLGPTILGYLPTWAIYFAVYDGIKRKFGERPLGEVDGGRHVYPAAQVKGYQPLAREHPWTLHILSAMAAGATSTICTNPLWVIKTRFMGWRAFFRGLLPSLLGITHVAVQFPLYEHLKRVAVTYPHEVVRTRFQTEKRLLNGNGGHEPNTERRGIIRMTQHIVTHEGWRALYRGLSVNLVRTVPNSAVTMLTYEMLMRSLNRRSSLS
uniref:Uncharacterized protein n=1 Tax=Ganoderma boninense TaxID=34458 RepID=A0A5K1K5N4_9APHY|nr:Uncharacterized protein [Ganoderma boninense]